MKFQGKTIVVTGGSSGIGSAIIEAFVDQKPNIVICYRKNEAAAKKLEKSAQEKGAKTLLFQGDLAKESAIKQLFKETMDTFGSVDLLVNVAGGAYSAGVIPDTTRDHWVQLFDDNLFSAVLCSQEAVKIMRKQEGLGKIINISSVLGEIRGGRQGVIAYSAAKAALINFTQTLAKQEAPKILINTVSPGRTKTPYYDKFDEAKLKELMAPNIIGRFIKPSEIADAVLFVAKNDAMTGELVTVSGGFFL